MISALNYGHLDLEKSYLYPKLVPRLFTRENLKKPFEIVKIKLNSFQTAEICFYL